MGGVMYHIKAISALIRTTIKIVSKNCPSVEKNRLKIFDF